MRPTPHDLLVLTHLETVSGLSESETALLESLRAQSHWSPRQARELDRLLQVHTVSHV